MSWLNGALYWLECLVDAELVARRVVHHERQPVDEALLGDGLGFVDARRGDAGFLVRLLGGGNGVVFLVAPGEESRGDGARERKGGDNRLGGFMFGSKVGLWRIRGPPLGKRPARFTNDDVGLPPSMPAFEARSVSRSK